MSEHVWKFEGLEGSTSKWITSQVGFLWLALFVIIMRWFIGTKPNPDTEKHFQLFPYWFADLKIPSKPPELYRN